MYFHSPPFISAASRDKVETLARRLATRQNGLRLHVVHFTEIQKAIKAAGGDRLTVSIARAQNRDTALATLSPLCTGRVEVAADGLSFSAPIKAGDRVVPGVIRALDDAGIDVLDVEVRRPTLDDVFLSLTGRRAEGDLEEAM